jgi:predicted small lipoprotein YifL
MPCRAGYLFIVVVLVLGAMSIIGACGRRGPLYLPEEPAAQTPTPVPDTGSADSPSAAMPSPAPPVKP